MNVFEGDFFDVITYKQETAGSNAAIAHFANALPTLKLGLFLFTSSEVKVTENQSPWCLLRFLKEFSLSISLSAMCDSNKKA